MSSLNSEFAVSTLSKGADDAKAKGGEKSAASSIYASRRVCKSLTCKLSSCKGRHLSHNRFLTFRASRQIL